MILDAKGYYGSNTALHYCSWLVPIVYCSLRYYLNDIPIGRRQ